MSYLESADSQYGFFDVLPMKEKGLELREQYQSADPFPHIAIDNFCPPEVIETCLRDFPKTPDLDSRTFDRDQERFKTSYNPDFLTPHLRSFFYSLNSRPFIQFLENMTGVEGLIPDPYFLGGGFHETKQGGHLSVHADFNHHKKLNVERRLNLLIYLNKDWRDEYGGSLELWDKGMKNCVQRITPEYNRCVVFSTNDTSYHGHPTPLNHPDGQSRRSLALYYYTATWGEDVREKTTQFKVRPNSTDKIDWTVKQNAFMDEFLPPIFARALRKIMR